MANLKIGVIIGRFQVPRPHEGHWALFKTVAEASDHVVFLLGVSPVDGRTAENPLTFNQRRHILSMAFYSAIMGGVTIFPLLDCRTNEEWSAQIDGLLKGAFPEDTITLYGGRDSFVQSYRGTIPVERVNLVPVAPQAGTDIRAGIKEEQSYDFYRGQIYALRKQFPHAYPTVDMAVHRKVKEPIPAWPGESDTVDEVLVIQRADSGRWCFPGGFVDPTDETMELAAKRELHEELSLITEAPAHYIGSHRINDFRYRGSRDKIVTTFFLMEYSWGVPQPNPDEVQDFKWVRPFDNPQRPDAFKIADTHEVLWDALRRYLVNVGLGIPR